MALPSTIYKFRINLSDLDREHYALVELTVALHPSESMERMAVRVLAYCLNDAEGLALCKGLSDTDQPDVWQREMDDTIRLWIEVGEPSPERLKLASRRSDAVRVYCFNSKANTWWQQGASKLSRHGAEIFQFSPEDLSTVVPLIERSVDWSMTISEATIYITDKNGQAELAVSRLSA